MPKRQAAAAPRPKKTQEPDDDFVPNTPAEGPPAKTKPAKTTPPVTVVRVESFAFASFNLHLSDKTVLGAIAAGHGSNAENAQARDRIVALLTQLVQP
jgi:hypothetical protein